MDPDRSRVLAELEQHLAVPMAVLGVAWLALVGLSAVHPSPMVHVAIAVLWLIFLAEFLVRLALAPDRRRWLRGHWLVALSLAVPPFRVLALGRLLLAFHLVARPLTLVRLVAAFNNSAGVVHRALHKRRAGYAAALTLLVILAGGAGMHALEQEVPDTPLGTYAGAVWWTAMLVTTVGSDYWPETPGGRALCLVLAIYGCAVFGYVTAAIATLFLGGRE